MADDAPANKPMGRKDQVSEEVDADAQWLEPDVTLQLEMQLGAQESGDLVLPGQQLLAIAVHQDEVVDVAQVTRGPQLVLCELIQRVQVDVREELAREIADRQASS